MISINNLSYFVGGRPLYDKASLHIKDRDRIGLIGLNGKGKTTLLKLINQHHSPDNGEISYSNECTIGFLNQDLLSFQSDDSILTVAMSAHKEVLVLSDKIDRLLKDLETNYSDEIIEKLGNYQLEFERRDGYTLKAKAEEVLEGIGFKTEELTKPLKLFSGGWRMRVMLAKLLLEKPSLLMLDEPTNHLDLPSIEWVENYLRNYSGAIIVVSHDRNFINNVANTIVEVDQLKLIRYSGNYDFYLEEKNQREEIQQNTFENQQKQIKQTERFIERFRAKASKSRQVQSKIKQLNKIDLIEEVADADPSINFQFNLAQRSGKIVMDLKDVGKSYGNNKILEHANAHIVRGDKIALIGANGKGKSTLLRIIAGTEKIEGERIEGHNLSFGFYAQHQLESLDVNNDILSELKMSGSGKSEQELRGVLGCFLFSSDDVFKKIKVLSGGEKSRVALARTLISEANFLLLDEPTNHLDFISENILIQALQQYEGSYIVVSHNRFFIKHVANKIWYIEDHKIKEYPGTFDEYVYWESQKKLANTKTVKNETPQPKQEVKKQTTEPSNAQNQEVKILKKRIAEAEEQIMSLEIQKDALEDEMSKLNSTENEKLQQLSMTYQQLLEQINTITSDWEKQVEQLDQLS